MWDSRSWAAPLPPAAGKALSETAEARQVTLETDLPLMEPNNDDCFGGALPWLRASRAGPSL